MTHHDGVVRVCVLKLGHLSHSWQLKSFIFFSPFSPYSPCKTPTQQRGIPAINKQCFVVCLFLFTGEILCDLDFAWSVCRNGHLLVCTRKIFTWTSLPSLHSSRFCVLEVTVSMNCNVIHFPCITLSHFLLSAASLSAFFFLCRAISSICSFWAICLKKKSRQGGGMATLIWIYKQRQSNKFHRWVIFIHAFPIFILMILEEIL